MDDDMEEYEIDEEYRDLLEEYLTTDKIEEIKLIFEESPSRLGLRKEEFKFKVIFTFDIPIMDEDFDVLFLKMDFNKDDHVSWDEFISFLMLEMASKEASSAVKLTVDLPIVGLPKTHKSNHRSGVIHVAHCPAVRPDRTVDYEDGKYITMSKDGMVNFWTLDLQLLRTYMDKSPHHPLRQTWVTNFVCLPNVSILCTSSTERELRFYDVTAKSFSLRFVFTIMPYCVNYMDYHFTEDPRKDSVLVCGDLGGNLRIMRFTTIDKGPFRSRVGADFLVLKWEYVVKGQLPLMTATDVVGVHGDWVRQVACYKLLGSVVSCSTSSHAMYMGDYRGVKNSYHFKLARGIETFDVNEFSPMIVTGSLDGVLRLWNPFFTSKPVALLEGHHATIVRTFFHEQGHKILSLDKDRVVKVWSSETLSCMQTYTKFAEEVHSIKDISACFNSHSHLLVVAGAKLESVTVDRLVDELRTDGVTHGEKVSVVLYNKLYKCVVTCGMDSSIVSWDLWTNKPKNCLRMAHTCVMLGEVTAIPITSGTFDPPNQLLATGARDGSIKLWDFISNTCLRTMNIERDCEVTKIMWSKGRILCIGWHKRLTEFLDTLTGNPAKGKAWESRHTDDLLSGDYRPGQAMATCTYNGDLIFWKLETGQSYKRYQVTYPTRIYKLEFKKEEEEAVKKYDHLPSPTMRQVKEPVRYNLDQFHKLRFRTVKEVKLTTDNVVPKEKPYLKLLAEKPMAPSQRHLAVFCVMFLREREMLPDQGTVLTALENGMIQVWSHHPQGGYIAAFRAVHTHLDYITCMQTDSSNEFLITGTCLGYLKIWLLKNYCLTQGVDTHVCLPSYRLMFPFLIKDRFRLRAKRAVEDQPLPMLLSSYRSHSSGLLHIEYLEANKILLTASADCSVRVWTLSGRYIGTLGQSKPWPTLEPGVDPETKHSTYRLPPDLSHQASATSLKVWAGAPPLPTNKYIKEEDLSLTEEERKAIYGRPLRPPQLGHFHEFPPRESKRKGDPVIDESIPFYLPVYTHLKVPPCITVQRPPTPPCVIQARQPHKNLDLYLEEANSTDKLSVGKN